MSERTFRGVVAVVLVLALALAVVVVAALLYRPALPEPSPSPSTIATPVRSPTPAVTPAGPVFNPPGVISVGLVARGSDSGETLVIEFAEPRADGIPDAPGSFQVSLADQAGDTSTIAFVGEPSVSAPGSLGVTVALAGPNVLQIDILASDTVNIESVTITGLGLHADQAAALGPITARASGFAGSLGPGIAADSMASPGTVVEPR